MALVWNDQPKFNKILQVWCRKVEGGERKVGLLRFHKAAAFPHAMNNFNLSFFLTTMYFPEK